MIQIANLPFCSPCLFEQHPFLCSSCSCDPSLKINFYDGLNRIDRQVKVLPSDKVVVNRFFKTRLKRLSFCMQYKDTRNCQEKVKKISHLKPNQLAPSIYIMKELCFFSLDQ